MKKVKNIKRLKPWILVLLTCSLSVFFILPAAAAVGDPDRTSYFFTPNNDPFCFYYSNTSLDGPYRAPQNINTFNTNAWRMFYYSNYGNYIDLILKQNIGTDAANVNANHSYIWSLTFESEVDLVFNQACLAVLSTGQSIPCEIFRNSRNSTSGLYVYTYGVHFITPVSGRLSHFQFTVTVPTEEVRIGGSGHFTNTAVTYQSGVSVPSSPGTDATYLASVLTSGISNIQRSINVVSTVTFSGFNSVVSAVTSGLDFVESHITSELNSVRSGISGVTSSITSAKNAIVDKLEAIEEAIYYTAPDDSETLDFDELWQQRKQLESNVFSNSVLVNNSELQSFYTGHGASVSGLIDSGAVGILNYMASYPLSQIPGFSGYFVAAILIGFFATIFGLTVRIASKSGGS